VKTNEISGKNPVNILAILEEGICYLALTLLAIIPIADVVLRLTMKWGFPDAERLLKHLLLVLGLLSGMLTTKKGEHLYIGIIQNFTSDKVKKTVSVVAHTLSAFVITFIAWGSFSFIRIGLMGWKICGIIPDRVFALVIPIGYLVIAFRFARLTPSDDKRVKLIPYLALILGTICAIPVLGKAIWPFDQPELMYELTEFSFDIAWYLKVPGAILLIVAALVGTPLFVVLGGLALLLIQSSGHGVDVVASQVYLALTQDSILPIPLFTVAGFILSESKAGERLVKAFRGLFGWFPGGMIVATVILCAFFTSFTGASGVTILALGGLLFYILSEHNKYPEKFSIGLLTSTGSIGLLFPPSLPIILVGATSMTNIMHLFVGGIIPGMILVVSMIIFGIVVTAKLSKGPSPAFKVEPFNLKETIAGVKESFFELLLPLLLVTGFFTGYLSITELGALSVLYVFIVEVIIHKDISIPEFPKVFRKAVPIIGGVLSIISLSMALYFFIIDTQAPQNLAYWMKDTIQSKVVFLLLLNLSLLFIGCLMDIFSAILIVLPLVIPLGAVYGIDPVHLGIIFIVNLELSFLTPPVGLNLFLSSYRFGKPFLSICRYVIPFLFIQLVVVALVTYVPWLSTWLVGFIR
jgi:tripartite ATP-independent transporter DctM subunit